MEVKCVRACKGVCVCVCFQATLLKRGDRIGLLQKGFTAMTNWKKGGVAVGVVYNKKVQNFKRDSCNVVKLCRKTNTFTGHGLLRPLP